MSNFNPSRRKFLSNSSKVALMASATPFISTLSMINEADKLMYDSKRRDKDGI